MKTTIIISFLFGVLWAWLPMELAGTFFGEISTWVWLFAGGSTGACAGWHTIRSRTKKLGREQMLQLLETYYLAISIFSLLLTAGYTVEFCWCLGEIEPPHWMLLPVLIWYFTILGTVPWGLLLLPLAWLTRLAVCNWHQRVAITF